MKFSIKTSTQKRQESFLYRLFALWFLSMSLSASAASDMDNWLNRLDESLKHHEDYEQIRIDRINKLKDQLRQAHGTDEFDLNFALFDEYKSYCYDSAVAYANSCLNLSIQLNDEQRILRSKNAIAFSLISAGILSEAREVLNSMDRSKLSDTLLCDYYDQQCRLWRSMADYVKEEPFYTQYISQSNNYLDSLLQLLPEGSMKWLSCKGSHQMRDNQWEEALVTLEKVLQQCGDDLHLRAMTCAEIAWAYVWLNNEEKAIEYFAQSAIADNESATHEITALYHLARLIYKQGDYERASFYVHQALEDVNFYNSRLRKVEINDILPIIEQDRYNAIRSQRNWYIAITVLTLALLLGILWGYWFIRRKNRKLTEARETIANQLQLLQVANNQLQQVNSQLQQVNSRLQQVNSQLTEADKIKTAYIGRSFYSNAEFIEKLEKVYRAIDRKITARQYDDLRYTLKESTLNSERESMYQSFDETFLKLFPNFVERFNMLFEEADRKTPQKANTLTSEMRIFALIRLGITDSERIAKFLDYSVHTVNTYKTRIKNRSTADNDKFEHLIMQI